MTFREAFLAACELNPKAMKGRSALLARLRRSDPRCRVTRRLWERMEKKVAARYRKETGQEVGDWREILDWLIENLPAILQIIMTILMLF
jgi:hypothetical protein